MHVHRGVHVRRPGRTKSHEVSLRPVGSQQSKTDQPELSIYLVDEVMQRRQGGEHAFNVVVPEVSNTALLADHSNTSAQNH